MFLNFVVGIMLFVFWFFKVGDVVNVVGIMVKVYEIDFFVMKFDMFDNCWIIIFNSVILNDMIENVLYYKEWCVDLLVGVGYLVDFRRICEVFDMVVEEFGDFCIEGEDCGY